MNDEPTVDRPEEPLPIDTCAQLLSNPVRTELLTMISAADGGLRYDHAVTKLADQFGETDDHDARERWELLLHHVHVPKLADAGVIERRENQLRLGDQADVVLDFLDEASRQ